jgi:hypothetical protein
VLFGATTVAHKSAWAGSKGFATTGIPVKANSIGFTRSLTFIAFQTIGSALIAGDNGSKSNAANAGINTLNLENLFI